MRIKMSICRKDIIMLDLKDFKDKRIHFIGIGGCSMSGLAMIMKKQSLNMPMNMVG